MGSNFTAAIRWCQNPEPREYDGNHPEAAGDIRNDPEGDRSRRKHNGELKRCRRIAEIVVGSQRLVPVRLLPTLRVPSTLCGPLRFRARYHIWRRSCLPNP
jgi:hypothetical protein